MCRCIARRIRSGKTHCQCRFPFPLYSQCNCRLRTFIYLGNAVEVFGEIGNHWKSGEGQFWKGYYWDGGILYKHRLVRYKNGMLRFRFGPEFGATERKFFLGIEGGFEYNYVFQNGWEFSLIQKNNVNFIHGDTFRNGLLIGLKIPF